MGTGDKNIVEKNDLEDFENFIKEHGKVLVDFYADWCGPCKKIAPELQELAKKYEGQIFFVKVDVDQASDWVGKYGVTAMPTFKFFVNGEEKREIKGADSSQLRKTIAEVFQV
jgi:thioredoxin 1